MVASLILKNHEDKFDEGFKADGALIAEKILRLKSNEQSPKAMEISYWVQVFYGLVIAPILWHLICHFEDHDDRINYPYRWELQVTSSIGLGITMWGVV